MRTANATSCLIDHEGGRLLEEGAKLFFGLRGQGRLGECTVHEFDPAVAGGTVNLEGKMPGAQTGVSPLGDVAFRSPKAIDQEIAKASFGGFALACRIHRSQNVVLRDLPVKGGDETSETFFPDD